MSNPQKKQNPCADCIYEDCYPGICIACQENKKSEPIEPSHNELIEIQTEEKEARYDPFWD